MRRSTIQAVSFACALVGTALLIDVAAVRHAAAEPALPPDCPKNIPNSQEVRCYTGNYVVCDGQNETACRNMEPDEDTMIDIGLGYPFPDGPAIIWKDNNGMIPKDCSVPADDMKCRVVPMSCRQTVYCWWNTQQGGTCEVFTGSGGTTYSADKFVEATCQ
jgi:hypothetical protein